MQKYYKIFNQFVKNYFELSVIILHKILYFANFKNFY